MPSALTLCGDGGRMLAKPFDLGCGRRGCCTARRPCTKRRPTATRAWLLLLITGRPHTVGTGEVTKSKTREERGREGRVRASGNLDDPAPLPSLRLGR